MGVEEHVRGIIQTALVGLIERGELPIEAADAPFTLDRPKRPEHGDLATNVALGLQHLAGRPPRELAELIAADLAEAEGIETVEIAGPGFLNLRLAPALFQLVLFEILSAKQAYGRKPAATGERILLEFVSANPTGPLLVSHGRGAILGDAIGRLLEATGHRVVREYYINDYGNQIRLLGDSVAAASRGEDPPEGGYKNDFVGEVAGWVAAREPKLLDGRDPERLARIAAARMLDGIPGSAVLPGIKRTLADLGVAFDAWVSEEGLHRWGRVDAALAELERRGHLEAKDGALFFKSGKDDDKDRVVRKSDGKTTYFASDIAYHADKVARGYDRLVTLWGADHHGYVARVQAALTALDLPADRSEVILYQLVHLLRDGKPYKMGKRLGNLITIDEVTGEIDQATGRAGAGADALRYFYLVRQSGTTIELDLELAKRQTLDNPVFYLQMGYARLCSIQRRAKEVFGIDSVHVTPDIVLRLSHPDELDILGRLGRYPSIVEEAARTRAPHRVVFFLQELSQAFQSYFTRLKAEGDTILPRESEMARPGWEDAWDQDKTCARLVWIEAIRSVYRAGLELTGIQALERMESPSASSDEGSRPVANEQR